MSAVVCGKRSSSIFDELLHTPPPASKRARCAAGASSPTSAVFRLSPSRASPSDDRHEIGSRGDANLLVAHLAHLKSLFPDMDEQLLKRVLEASGNDLDSAMKSLSGLRLESAEYSFDSAVGKSDTGSESETIVQLPIQGVTDNAANVNAVNLQALDGLPQDGSEWVELFVREMMSASDMNDAKARASRVLEVLEKAITSRAGAEAFQSSQKENVMLKEQVELLLRENNVLKRAVAIQHERQKDYDEKSQELQHLKHLVSQYQEQLRTLEVNNYALTMHLRQAQQSSSIPGRFHPDVF